MRHFPAWLQSEVLLINHSNKCKFMEKFRNPKASRFFPDREGFALKKLFRMLRFTLFCFFLSLIQVMALDSYSQQTRLTLNEHDRRLEDVLKTIEDKTEFFFLYNRDLINVDQRVDINITNLSIKETLDELLKGTDIHYSVANRQIILSNLDNNSILLIQQQKSVTGKVTDSSGGPLPGVSVVVKGTTTGTITDADGKYILANIPANATLAFSFVGMKSQEITIKEKSTINVKLEEETIGLEEVVAVGYGTMKKSDLTGSVSSVKPQEIKAIQSSNALQSLTGRIAGVNISQNTGAPGSTMSIRIRGINSIQGGNEPLYVIDGFPTNQSMLLTLNNSDIESIEVLKDASSTAIYGSRGANGVVLITTKQGKAKKTQIDFETSYGIQTLRKKMDLMDAKEYAMFVNETLINSNLSPYFSQEAINSMGDGFDWQDALFRSAPEKKVSLNLNSGNEKTQFSMGGSIFNQDGIIKRSDYNRYSLVLNLNHSISEKLSVNVSGKLSYVDTDRKDSGGGNRGGGIIGGTLSGPPTVSPYNEDGTYRDLRTAYPFMSNSISNSISELNEATSNRKENKILINASLIYKPIPELTIKLSGGVADNNTNSSSYSTNKSLGGYSTASMGTGSYRSLLNENTISYDKTFNQKHKISLLAGFTYQDFVNTSLSGSGTGYVSDITEFYDLGAAITPGIPSSGYSKSSLISALTRVNYVYNDKYLATLSFRGDGASQYSEGDKWGYFPSGALAWRMSNEDFFKGVPYITNLKLRASWGVAGNQAIGAYTTLNTLSSGNSVFGDGLHVTYAPGTRLPQNLKWESTVTQNIGIDLGLFENKVNLTADYYIKNTNDLLNTVGLPLSMGYTSTIQNIGKMQNKGFELGIDANPLNGDFKWNINFNVSINRNKIKKLYNNQDILGGSIDVNLVQDYINILREGQPVGRFWGYLEDGYDEKGQIKFKDLDGDKQITLKDKTYIGDPNPDFIYGLQSNMSYKNFELTFFLQGSYGNDIFNVSSINSTLDYGIGLNMPREVYLNHWTPDNVNAKYPIPKVSTNVKASNRFIEDGSYIRVKNIELAYNMNPRKMGMDHIRFYVSGQNLLTITGYSWWDPEVNSLGSAISQGIDYYTYPTAKVISMGIQVRF